MQCAFSMNEYGRRLACDGNADTMCKSIKFRRNGNYKNITTKPQKFKF